MIITGTDAADTLTGTAGTDEIQGLGGADTLDGGAGLDLLLGGAGNNTYRFGRGDGRDTIGAWQDATPNTGDATGKLNTLAFKAGVAPADVAVTRVGADLQLSIGGGSGGGGGGGVGGGTVIVQSFFLADDPGQAWNPLQQVQFADGSTWDLRSLVDRALTGTAGADILLGTLQDDTLDGGEGNDTVDGGLGNDTYRFGAGDGADRLRARADNRPVTGDESGKLNTLRFKDGVSPAEVAAARSGDDLVLRLAGGADSVTVERYFAGDDPFNASNPLQRAVFADGTAWGLQALTDLALIGSSGDDTLTGTVRADTLDGGAGDDRLDGGRGNDTYRYGAGDGADQILARQDPTPYTGQPTGRLGTLAFKAGVLPTDVSGQRVGDDLVLRLSDDDSVTVQTFFAGDDPRSSLTNPLHQATFADGTLWTLDALILAATTGTAGNDTLVGTVQDDTLDGRAGYDALDGGVGNNTYLFGLGDGADRLLSRHDPRPVTGEASGRLNTLQLKAGVTPDDVVLTRNGIDLAITLLGQDRFTVEGFFGGPSPALHSLNPLQQVRFTDGPTWDLASLVARVARPLSGTFGDDLITGTAGVDAISALSGRDTVRADGGNDAIDGGSGVDTVVYAADRAGYDVSMTAGGFRVAARSDGGATEGTDQLSGIERLRFADGGLALDLDGQAGQVAKLLGAVFGPAAVANRAYAAAGLALLGEGMSYPALGALALSVAGSSTPTAIVERLWANVVGTPLPDGERSLYVGLLDGGLPVGALVVVAADSAFNAARIDLAGLATTGLAFD